MTKVAAGFQSDVINRELAWHGMWYGAAKASNSSKV